MTVLGRTVVASSSSWCTMSRDRSGRSSKSKYDCGSCGDSSGNTGSSKTSRPVTVCGHSGWPRKVSSVKSKARCVWFDCWRVRRAKSHRRQPTYYSMNTVVSSSAELADGREQLVGVWIVGLHWAYRHEGLHDWTRCSCLAKQKCEKQRQQEKCGHATVCLLVPGDSRGA